MGTYQIMEASYVATAHASQLLMRSFNLEHITPLSLAADNFYNFGGINEDSLPSKFS